METETPYTAPAPRWLEIAAGLGMAFFGLGLLALVAAVLYVSMTHGRRVDATMGWFVASFVAIGGFCSNIAWRLLAQRPRARDHGLFGPTLLRIGGLILGVGGVLQLQYWPAGLLGCGVSIAAASACFALARARAQRV